jgi:hypothetical protein
MRDVMEESAVENVMMGGVITRSFSVLLAWLEAGVQVIEACQHGCTKA